MLPSSTTETPPVRQVTVFGAAGFIGRFVVEELLRQGWRVRAFVHTPEENVFAALPEVNVFRGDVRDGSAVHRSLVGSAAAVNLAGAKSDEPDSESTNVGGAQRIVEAASAHGGTRLIHFSTQAVKIARKGLYARTKLAADRVFEASGLPVTILRPSVVYGPGRSGVFSTMQRFVERLPVVPVLGDGRWVSAPVHVHDIATAVAACLVTPVTIGRCYDLGGPDFVTLDEILDRVAAQCGRPCRKLHIPFGVALLAARISVRLLPHPPISVSNVLGSNQAIPIDLAPARHDFGFQPMSLADGLRLMAEEAGQAALRKEARGFARYLLNVAADDEIVARYVAAARQLFAGNVDTEVVFIRRYGWSLPFVDAATAIVRPRSQLRQRLLLMAAVLEASPAHAGFFLAPPPQRFALLLGLGVRGLSSAVKLLAGAVLLPFIHPTCRRISM